MIHSVDVKTGKKTTRDYTAKELAEIAARPEPVIPEPTDQEIATDHVLSTMTAKEKDGAKIRIKAK